MAEDESLADASEGREYLRVLLALVCGVAVVLAVLVLPAAPSFGTGGASLGNLAVQGPGSGELGALNPSDSTEIGGNRSANPYRSQSKQIHFTVESPVSAYWRTGAYDAYTGSGWDSDPDPQPYDGSIASPDDTGQRVSYRVTLEKSATGLPTVWRPHTVSLSDAMVTDADAVRSERTLSAGTQYNGTSYVPPDDPTLLRTSGRDYPDSIEDQYTDLSETDDERLSSFTDDLTADSDSPYETATAIEQWLETNKSYSLDPGQEPGDNVASQFVFEMNQGYCEYFATSMAVILRTQDIPSRYVVGYLPGNETDKNEYTVRGTDAHAWVEVYFEDVGWVTFDPTPPRELPEQNETSDDNETADGDPSGESDDPPNDESTTDGEPSGEADDPPDDESTTDGGYDISLNRTAVPGASVMVTVTEDNQPVSGVEVSFNDDPVGLTDSNGTVVGTVPYTANLTVTAGSAVRQAALRPSVSPRQPLSFAPAQPRQETSNESFELNTDATVETFGTVATGETVTVVATIDDIPVRAAAVSVDGEQVTTTDSSGKATVTLPTEPGNATIAVQRDSVSGERTLDLGELRVETTPELPLALPGSELTVTATLGGEPAPNATIAVGGTTVGTTGPNGTATVSLPLESSVTVTATQYGQQSQSVVGSLVRNLAVVLAATLGLVGAVGYAARRRGIGIRTVFGWLHTAGQLAVGALISLAAGIDTALTRLWTRARLTVRNLLALVVRQVTLRTLLSRFRQWFTDRRQELESTAASATEAVAGATPRSAANGESGARVSIQSAWRRFLDHVSIRNDWTRTPGEIATHAVETDDIRPEAVETLRDEYRAVEYGQRDPTDRVAAVERAIETIEADERNTDQENTDA